MAVYPRGCVPDFFDSLVTQQTPCRYGKVFLHASTQAPPHPEYGGRPRPFKHQPSNRLRATPFRKRAAVFTKAMVQARCWEESVCISPSPLLKAVILASAGFCNGSQRFPGEKSLVTGDQHIGESKHAHKHVIVDDFVRQVAKKQVAFLFVHVQAQVTHLAALEAVDDGITPGFI